MFIWLEDCAFKGLLQTLLRRNLQMRWPYMRQPVKLHASYLSG